MPARRLLIPLAFLLLAPPASVAAQDLYRIRVDLKEKKTTPENPAINLQERAPSITLDFSGDPRKTPPTAASSEFQVGRPDITTYIRTETVPGSITYGDKLYSLGTSHSVTILPCTPDAFASRGLSRFRPTLDPSGKPRTGATAHLVDRDIHVDMCPFAVLDRRWTNSWTVFTNPGALSFTLQSYAKISDFYRSITQTNHRYSYAVPIAVQSAPFSLAWSAGLGFFDDKHHRYTLRKIPDDDERVQLDRLDDSSNPYRAAAAAHYRIIKAPAISLTAGVGLDVPVKDPAFMAGISFSAPTIQLLDNAYLTFGVAYSSVDRLKPKFRGLETVPATTRESDLLEKDQEVGFFLSLTYAFAGGEKQFKGVFSLPSK